MAYKPADLANEDFFHSYLAEYLDGELSGELRTRFDEIMKSPGRAQIPEHFQTMRGRLQLALQSYYLKEQELQGLRAFVQDPAITATKEEMRINQLSRREALGNLMRRLSLAAIVVLIFAGLAWKFMPRSTPTFKALEYLGYEALAMEEDDRGRLDLPSSDLREIQQYFAQYPGLDFKPRTFESIPPAWRPQGVSVIDYETAKVGVVQFANKDSKEKLFHFSYAGKLEDLPKSDQNKFGGLSFQTYASDELNLVAWQDGSGVVSLLIGRRAVPELYEIASSGSKK